MIIFSSHLFRSAGAAPLRFAGRNTHAHTAIDLSINSCTQFVRRFQKQIEKNMAKQQPTKQTTSTFIYTNSKFK